MPVTVHPPQPATMSTLHATREAFPSTVMPELTTTSHSRHGFTISARKLPISKSNEIEEMEKNLHIPVPEMIFGNNLIAIEYQGAAGEAWKIEFNAFDALDMVDKTDKQMLKVAYSSAWSRSRYVGNLKDDFFSL